MCVDRNCGTTAEAKDSRRHAYHGALLRTHKATVPWLYFGWLRLLKSEPFLRWLTVFTGLVWESPRHSVGWNPYPPLQESPEVAMDACLVEVPYHAGDDGHPASLRPRRLLDDRAADLLARRHTVTVKQQTCTVIERTG
jgi:hypothetical protein